MSGDTRFRKGQSGNPKGRPRQRRPHVSAFDIVFDKVLTVTQGGRTRDLSVDEALQLQTYQAALQGSRMAVRKVLKMIEKREAALAKRQTGPRGAVTLEHRYDSDNANEALRILGIIERDPDRTDARLGQGGDLGDAGGSLASRPKKVRPPKDRGYPQVHHGPQRAPVATRADRVMEGEPAGYGKPPAASRFRKGQSGNPAGRPRNRHREIPYDAILGQMVTIREDGRTRRVTAAEAFLLQLTRKGLAGDSAAARASLEAIEAARDKRPRQTEPLTITLLGIANGISTILEPLGITTRTTRADQECILSKLNPWIVEAAMARMAPRQLTHDEQREVWRNTRTPDKVRWPEWWSVRE